jgi:plasmid replication initiation protein
MVYMSGETVVYHNDMNLVPLRNFTPVELDLLFAMCNKLKEQEDSVLRINFKDLKQLSNYDTNTRNIKRFVSDLQRVYDKMLTITYTLETPNKIKRFVLFHTYEIDKENRYIEISTSKDLKYILNNITNNFTKFELEEFSKLKSSYSKNMYRLLKQYKHTGYFKIKMDDFKSRLDVPDSYRMTNITQKILKPISDELRYIFPNLQINKIKAHKGRKIAYIEFVFDPEQRIESKKQPDKAHNSKSKRKQSRELTPEWLEGREQTQPDEAYTSEVATDEEREAFLQHLKERWGDDDE